MKKTLLGTLIRKTGSRKLTMREIKRKKRKRGRQW